jgi:hypothetical protein
MPFPHCAFRHLNELVVERGQAIAQCSGQLLRQREEATDLRNVHPRAHRALGMKSQNERQD